MGPISKQVQDSWPLELGGSFIGERQDLFEEGIGSSSLFLGDRDQFFFGVVSDLRADSCCLSRSVEVRGVPC